MKKIVSYITALTILIIPVNLLASEEVMFYDEATPSFEDVVYANQLFEISLFAGYNNLENRYNRAKEAIIAELKNFNPRINITEFHLPLDMRDALFSDIFFSNPELFYINNSCKFYRVSQFPNDIAIIEFSFAYTASEYAVRKQKFDNEIDKITSLITPNMSELEKALIVHDYIDLHCEYDTAFDTETNSFKAPSYRADGIIVDKVGVCQSYSMAYYYIMNLIGVETDYVESKNMNHIWNIFKIGDNWYHVDSTWDDPLPNSYAHVDHTYFLASDDLISSGENPHYDWVANHECSDTSLDDHFWRNIKGAIALDGEGRAYYHTGLKSSSGNFPYYYFEILSHNLNTHATQIIRTEEKKYWYVWGKKTFYTEVFSDVSFFDGKLYYNTPTEIIEIKTDGCEPKTIVNYNIGDGYIYGSMLDEHYLLYGIAQHPEIECSKPEHELKELYTSLINRISCAPSDENSVSVNISVLRKYLDYKNMPGKILASLYDENDTVAESIILDLTDCGLEDEESTVPLKFAREGKYIKLMWWDMTSLAPISENIIYYL